MTRRNPKLPKSADPKMAIAAADAFRELSRPFLDLIGKDIRDAHLRAVQNLGRMIASATSLALSVELYLKAVRLAVGLHATTNHDLWALYKGLPQELKTSIEKRYQELGAPQGADIHMIQLQISVGPFQDDQVSKAEKTHGSISGDNSLQATLKRTRDAFQTWRYLHEKGDPDEIVHFSYEFHYLGNIADSLRAHFVLLHQAAKAAKVKPSDIAEDASAQ